jgi:hypothetical protein
MSLDTALSQATTQSQVVCLLVALTGRQLMPRLIFTSNGELVTFEALRALAADQIALSADSPVLEINLEQAMQGEETVSSPKADDVDWFEKKFGFRPSSPRAVREYLLTHGLEKLCYYLDQSCNPWNNLEAQIAHIRAHEH